MPQLHRRNLFRLILIGCFMGFMNFSDPISGHFFVTLIAVLLGLEKSVNRASFLEIPCTPAFIFLVLNGTLLLTIIPSRTTDLEALWKEMLASAASFCIIALIVASLTSGSQQPRGATKPTIVLEYHAEAILDGRRGYWIARLEGSYFHSGAHSTEQESLEALLAQLNAAKKHAELEFYRIHRVA